MELNATEIMKSTMVLFAVIDIVGSIPVLMDVKSKAGNIHPGRLSGGRGFGRWRRRSILSTQASRGGARSASEELMPCFEDPNPNDTPPDKNR